MAAAAAAAAAKADRLLTKSQKQRDTLHKEVKDLLDVGFTEFKFKLKHVANDYSWPNACLNTDLVDMPDSSHGDLTDEDILNLKNLYNLLINKCETSKEVYALLKQVPPGPWQGRHAWIVVSGHFRKKTQGGLRSAQRD